MPWRCRRSGDWWSGSRALLPLHREARANQPDFLAAAAPDWQRHGFQQAGGMALADEAGAQEDRLAQARHLIGEGDAFLRLEGHEMLREGNAGRIVAEHPDDIGADQAITPI